MNIITSKEAKEQIHPLVKTHPETQKKDYLLTSLYLPYP